MTGVLIRQGNLDTDTRSEKTRAGNSRKAASKPRREALEESSFVDSDTLILDLEISVM